jgi:hypothetical protein
LAALLLHSVRPWVATRRSALLLGLLFLHSIVPPCRRNLSLPAAVFRSIST